MVKETNGNQFRDDEIIILDQLRDGKWVKNIFPKIAGRSLLLQRGEGTALHHHGDHQIR